MRKAGWSLTPLAVSIALAALALQAPSRLSAQVLKGAASKGAQIEIIPFAGAMLPLGHLIDESGVILNHRANVLFGGRFDAWFTKVAGVEVAVGYALSGYHGEATGLGGADTTGSHLSASARLLYRLSSTGTTSWHLMVGGGIVKHGGAAMDGLTGTTDLSGVAGIAARFNLSPSLALQVTAEDYLYSASFGASGATGSTAGKLNNDLMLSLGLVVPLGGH